MRTLLALISSIFILVSCSKSEKETPVITNIQLDKLSLNLFIDSSYTFNVSHTPSNLSAPNYVWTSSDENILKISQTGKVIAISEGVVKITVTAPDLDLKSECTITVSDVKATSISFLHDNIEITIGNEHPILYTILPKNTTYTIVKWSSSNVNIATVDNSGTVKAIAPGNAVITAKTFYGLTATCNIKVNPIEVSDIQIQPTSLNLEIGNKATITATVLPENATDKSIIFNSTDSNIATVSTDGNVSANNIGTTTITVKDKSNKIVKSINVTITDISDITKYIKLGDGGTAISMNNKVWTGSFYSKISNNSPYIIKTNAIYVYDGYNNLLYASNVSEVLGNITSGNSSTFNYDFSSTYNPYFIWSFEWNGKNYLLKKTLLAK